MEAMNNYLSQLSIDNMMRHLRVIASYERHAGTAQERLAFDYIRDTLQNLGCEVQYGTHAAYISIPQSATLAVNGRMIRTRTHSMSASTASGGIEGEVVYRDAIKPNESFEGKLIAMPGRAIYQKLAAGQAAGAIGMIFIQEEPVRECIPSAAWGSPTAEDMQYMPTRSEEHTSELQSRGQADCYTGRRLAANPHAHGGGESPCSYRQVCHAVRPCGLLVLRCH